MKLKKSKDWTCHSCGKVLNHHDAWYCSDDGKQYCYKHLPKGSKTKSNA